jgi:hypothetical protein
MPDDLTKLADSLPGWDTLPPPVQSAPGQLEIFDTGRGLARKQKRDYDQGQEFLFDPRTNKEMTHDDHDH